MKGLLFKELYQLCSNAKILLLYIVVFGITAIFSNNPAFFSAMGAVIVFSLPMNSMAFDERAGWDKMAAATPVGRRAVIAAKYLMILLLALVTVAVQLVVIVISAVIHPGSDVLEMTLVALVSVAVMGIIMMMMFPLLIKKGVEKGRMLMMLLFGSGFAVILLLGWLSESLGISLAGFPIAPWMPMTILLTLLVVAVAVSYQLSCRFYSNKEF
ncbi:MAG: ABC-2 transporter permease [Angelakisella sp.]